MINYTTPTITLTIEGMDITANEIYVTIQQKDHKLTKGPNDLTATAVTHGQQTDTEVELILTQRESAYFDYQSAAYVQVNWIAQDGTRGATGIKKLNVLQNLLDEVVNYGA